MGCYTRNSDFILHVWCFDALTNGWMDGRMGAVMVKYVSTESLRGEAQRGRRWIERREARKRKRKWDHRDVLRDREP